MSIKALKTADKVLGSLAIVSLVFVISVACIKSDEETSPIILSEPTNVIETCTKIFDGRPYLCNKSIGLNTNVWLWYVPHEQLLSDVVQDAMSFKSYDLANGKFGYTHRGIMINLPDNEIDYYYRRIHKAISDARSESYYYPIVVYTYHRGYIEVFDHVSYKPPER